jgi:hypothetical protein
MKKALVLGVVLLTASCGGSILNPKSWNNMGDAPRVVAGDESGFVVYSPIGLTPSNARAAADRYCKPIGKSSHYVHRGGLYHECESAQLNPPLCATYSCE